MLQAMHRLSLCGLFSYRFLFLDKFHGFIGITHRYFNDITTFRQIGDIYGGFFRNFNQFACQIIYGNGRIFVDTVYIKYSGLVVERYRLYAFFVYAYNRSECYVISMVAVYGSYLVNIVTNLV